MGRAATQLRKSQVLCRPRPFPFAIALDVRIEQLTRLSYRSYLAITSWHSRDLSSAGCSIPHPCLRCPEGELGRALWPSGPPSEHEHERKEVQIHPGSLNHTTASPPDPTFSPRRSGTPAVLGPTSRVKAALWGSANRCCLEGMTRVSRMRQLGKTSAQASKAKGRPNTGES